jgi:hypothetical protein
VNWGRRSHEQTDEMLAHYRASLSLVERRLGHDHVIVEQLRFELAPQLALDGNRQLALQAVYLAAVGLPPFALVVPREPPPLGYELPDPVDQAGYLSVRATPPGRRDPAAARVPPLHCSGT